MCMPADAELSRPAVAELKALSKPDVADFFRRLKVVCAAPIKNSEAFYDVEVSGYVLRRFSFGVGVERIAIFHYDGETVRVIRCRLSRPRRRRSPNDRGEAGPP
jgi:hypothetical protein